MEDNFAEAHRAAITAVGEAAVKISEALAAAPSELVAGELIDAVLSNSHSLGRLQVAAALSHRQ